MKNIPLPKNIKNFPVPRDSQETKMAYRFSPPSHHRPPVIAKSIEGSALGKMAHSLVRRPLDMTMLNLGKLVAQLIDAKMSNEGLGNAVLEILANKSSAISIGRELRQAYAPGSVALSPDEEAMKPKNAAMSEAAKRRWAKQRSGEE